METMELDAPPIIAGAEAAAVPPGGRSSPDPGLTVEYFVGRTSLGTTLVAVTGEGVCAVLLGDDEDELRLDLAARFPVRRLQAGEEPGSWMNEALACVEGAPRRPADLPLDLKGTDFQKSVWAALLDIPVGETVTYSQLAAKIGRPSSVRAVARACGANPIAVIVPCHRVLRGDGSISGYRWGVDRKRALLAREGASFTG